MEMKSLYDEVAQSLESFFKQSPLAKWLEGGQIDFDFDEDKEYLGLNFYFGFSDHYLDFNTEKNYFYLDNDLEDHIDVEDHISEPRLRIVFKTKDSVLEHLYENILTMIGELVEIGELSVEKIPTMLVKKVLDKIDGEILVRDEREAKYLEERIKEETENEIFGGVVWFAESVQNTKIDIPEKRFMLTKTAFGKTETNELIIRKIETLSTNEANGFRENFVSLEAEEVKYIIDKIENLDWIKGA